MATYKEIFGTNIEVLASDPSNPVEGQVWYNSTSNVVKGASVTTSGSWATGGNLNTARYLIGSMGTQDAALGAGGITTVLTAATELYNGTSWTEVNDLNTARQGFACGGIQTSGVAFGGYTTTVQSLTESWNGSSWTEVSDLNTARYALGGTGSSNTNAIAFAGNVAPGGTAVSEKWNGTSWSNTPSLNTARYALAGAGADNTSAIAAGGSNPGTFGGDGAFTEIWNDTAWTEVNDLNTARASLLGRVGITNICFSFGWSPSPSTESMEWNKLDY
jgi:hypothetical protein